MPQTLLALAAMMMATLFALNQQRGIMQTRMTMMRNEVATAATGVAVDRLEEIRVMAFDEATRENAITSPLSLTHPTGFTSDDPADDIDDFDGTVVDRFRVWMADTLWYRVETNVVYALESNPDTPVSNVNTRTKFKKATVRVYSTTVANTDTITISQSFACGSRCDW